MPVTDFECQIARGQIGRYLSGSLLSPQAMSGLEEHLAECPECKSLVAERRAALLGMLGNEMPTKAVVSMPVREENPLIAAVRNRAESLKSAATAEEIETPKAKPAGPRYAKPEKIAKKKVPAKAAPAKAATDKKSVVAKPLILSALLAVVLIGMSYMTHSNNGKGALGAHASETLPDAPAKAPQTVDALFNNTKPTTVSTTTITPTPNPTAVVNKPVAEVKPTTPETVPPVKPATTTNPPVKTEAKAETKPAVVTEPPVKEVAPKPAVVATVKKPVATVKKPVVAKPKLIVHRIAKPKAHRIARKRPVVRKARRAAAQKSSSTVRIYGLDGRPLK